MIKTRALVEIPMPDNFNLNQTLDCGQCFRFYETDKNVFEGVAFDRYIKIEESSNSEKLKFFTDEEIFGNVWFNYFDLNTDYKSIAKKLSELSPILKDACKFAPGIRILKQEPFEALISFIISQNNNIKRIKGIVKRLCENFGDPILDNPEHFSFPKPDVIASLKPEDLSVIRCGFRDKYIIDAARKVVYGDVDLYNMYSMPIGMARENLMLINGVGPKVADCVLLYGLHRFECFPLDVWTKRIMSNLFPDKDTTFFGQYAGIAQQYLFHYVRLNTEILDK